MSPLLTLDRRRLLQAGAALALPLLFSRCKTTPGNGPPLRRDPSGILDLPEGFRLVVLQRSGATMNDGLRVPDAPDGMGCFPGADANTLVLMRNHELTTSGGPGSPAHAYDPAAVGGVTRLVLDATTLNVVSSNLVLAGTRRNCAGGVSPWGWLTCEEDVSENHGFVFLCDPHAASVQPAVRIPAYGRMNHEAAVVDPLTHAAYLTEDRDDSCLYRFLPDAPDQVPGPATTGKLQALRVVGAPGRDLDQDVSPGARLAVDWVDLTGADAPDDDLRTRAHGLGAARFRRGEGAFFDQGAVLFTATTGGPAGGGQVWRYHPQSSELELMAQAEDRNLLDTPDNLCVAPWGDVVLAEDSYDPRWAGNSLRVLTPEGLLLDLARNALSSSEFAGVCFSPSGDTLFCNLQGDGITLAIQGPFQRLGALR